MTEVRMSGNAAEVRKWTNDTKLKAKELLLRAKRIAKEMFETGDIKEYLELLSRLDNYDAFNLLLILQQYPQASCLAGFKTWQKQMDRPGAQVLKPEWRGKGIDLIAPYTEGLGNGKFALTWYSLKQFDISQTNIRNYKAEKSVYVKDDSHISVLIEAMRAVLGERFQRSVLKAEETQELRAANLPGQLTDRAVTVRKDLKPTQKLSWLAVCLCRLSIETDLPFTSAQKDYIARAVLHCLYTKWGIAEPAPFRKNEAVTSSVQSSLQIEFLSLIGRTFRSLDESISFAYSNIRSGDENEEILLRFPN